MSLLVAYASRYGATRQIAQLVGAVLAVAGHDVRVRPAGEVADVGTHDAVVLGSSLYGGRWLSEASAFVRDHESALSARPVWLFSSGTLGWTPADPDQDLTRFGELIGARGLQVFGGALVPRRLDMVDRAVRLRPSVRGSLPAGDFRDWDAVEDWARMIAEQLVRPAA